MKKIIIKLMIFALLVLSVANALNCLQYNCDMSSIKTMSSSYCIYTISNVQYLQPCDTSSYSCIPGVNVNQTKCTYATNYIPNSLLPGIKCNYASDCSSTNDCKNGFCQGSGVDTPCSSNSACNVGYYCSRGLCASQIQVNSYGCLSDYDCVNTAGCFIKSLFNSSLNQCVMYNSLPNGATFGASPNSLLCASAFVYNLTCFAAPVSSQIPNVCSSNSQCVSMPTQGMVFNSNCQCGYNADGISYCAAFPGDNVYLSYLAIAKKWVSSQAISNCHTLDRFGVNCIQQYWDTKDSTSLLYHTLYALNYPLVYDAEDCALEIFLPLFYKAKNQYSSGIYLMISLISFFF